MIVGLVRSSATKIQNPGFNSFTATCAWALLRYNQLQCKFIMRSQSDYDQSNCITQIREEISAYKHFKTDGSIGRPQHRGAGTSHEDK